MIKQRPFRFGVLASPAESRSQWTNAARHIEKLGYSTLLALDHITYGLSPVVSLMAAADATTKLRVGSQVFCNDYRHPVILAKDIAMLDLLTEGRLEVGLGAGWQQSEYEQIGLQYDRPGVRIERFEESLKILKGLWSEGPVTFEGKHYKITDLEGTPKPVQKPAIPLYIGGGGKRVLSIAAREADIVGIVPIARASMVWHDQSDATEEVAQRKVSWVQEVAGERFPQIELQSTVFAIVVTDHRMAVAEQMGSQFGLSAHEMLSTMNFLIGTVDQMCEDLIRRREMLGISYISIQGSHVNDFAPVVERLAGS